MTIPIKAFAACLVLPLVLIACGRSPGPAGHDHGTAAGHGDHGHSDHGHGGGESLVYTNYTDVTELFVEFPPLVVGRPSSFAAHVTRLKDYAPLTSGTMDVLLRKNEKTVARFRVREPTRTGIFTPAVSAREAGEFQLAIEVQDGDLRARHNLGTVTVFADAESAAVNQPESEGDISYLKEQQWVNPFAAQPVGMRPLRSSVPGFATVAAPADASATVRAPSDGYYTAATIVSAGEKVAADTLLGYLIPRLGEGTDIGSLMVDIERARAKLALAKRDVERLQSLLDQGAIPERRLVEARQALEVARVELQTAQSRMTQQSGTSSEAGIALRSPVNGELIAVNVRPGAFVRAGAPLFTLADPSRRWLEIRVPEKFAESIRSATGAWLDFDKDGNASAVVLDADHAARVVQVDSVIDPGSRTATVTVEYPSAHGPTVIGARYPAHVLSSAPESRLAIPRSAIIDDGGQPVVYVQTGGETFARRGVTLGIVDGDFVEVLQGVELGERVVAKGAYYVKLAAAGGDEIGHGHAH